jgi:hypothetical protein
MDSFCAASILCLLHKTLLVHECSQINIKP